MTIQHHISLRSFNTFGIDAKAYFFAEAASESTLLALLQQPQIKEMPLLILGGGSNMLFLKDFEGMVIHLTIKGIDVVKETDEYVWVKSGAGVVWHDLVQYAVANNWGGIENLSLIPGTVGAAPIQNIGAYGVEIKETFDSLEAIHISSGEKQVFDKEACNFGYRDSIFKQYAKNQYIITSVTFRLNKKNAAINMSYGAISDTLHEMGISSPTLQDISNAVITIRQSKLPNPAELGNAGSFFKNPEIAKIQFDTLQQSFPSIPSYPAPHGLIKVPAGWLIEQSGWKGKRVGNCGVHSKQALVIVNYGGATGQEIKNLAMQIQADVLQKFGVEIMPEVNFIS